MIRALYSAASGMTAQQMSIDTIANNLANANTAGYKARRTQFQDLLYQNVVQPGTSAGSQTIVPNGLQLGLGTRPSTNTIVFTQGSFQETDNPLDVVIQGKGFFQIKLPSGTIAYTRAGNFQMDATGNIVDSNGNAMQPQINIPAASQRARINGDAADLALLDGEDIRNGQVAILAIYETAERITLIISQRRDRRGSSVRVFDKVEVGRVRDPNVACGVGTDAGNFLEACQRSDQLAFWK